MAQELTVKYWKPWENEEGLVRDNHGNYKGTVVFEEEPGQMVDATFKQEPAVGDKKYGDILEYETKSGSIRQKFQRAERPQDGQQSFTKRTFQPRDDAAIQAQWALGRAYEIIQPKKQEDWAKVKQDATHLMVLVQEVKGGEPSLKDDGGHKETGYDAFKASRPGNKSQEREQDEVHTMFDANGPVNLDDIPF